MTEIDFQKRARQLLLTEKNNEFLFAMKILKGVDDQAMDMLRYLRVEYQMNLNQGRHDENTALLPAFIGTAERIVRAAHKKVISAKFIFDHGLTSDDFETQHWQVIFALEYPELSGDV